MHNHIVMTVHESGHKLPEEFPGHVLRQPLVFDHIVEKISTRDIFHHQNYFLGCFLLKRVSLCPDSFADNVLQ